MSYNLISPLTFLSSFNLEILQVISVKYYSFSFLVQKFLLVPYLFFPSFLPYLFLQHSLSIYF